MSREKAAIVTSMTPDPLTRPLLPPSQVSVDINDDYPVSSGREGGGDGVGEVDRGTCVGLFGGDGGVGGSGGNDGTEMLKDNHTGLAVALPAAGKFEWILIPAVDGTVPHPQTSPPDSASGHPSTPPSLSPSSVLWTRYRGVPDEHEDEANDGLTASSESENKSGDHDTGCAGGDVSSGASPASARHHSLHPAHPDDLISAAVAKV